MTGKTLNVTITPDKESYAPREKATITVRVTNERGDPVSTELSLAMVDEAIFALSDELSGPIFDAFYQAREQLVRTYNSMAPRRYLGGGRGGGGGGGDLAGNPRSDFPDTAQWFPGLYTDHNGEVVVSFVAARQPDQLAADGQGGHGRHPGWRDVSQHPHQARDHRAPLPAAGPHSRRPGRAVRHGAQL